MDGIVSELRVMGRPAWVNAAWMRGRSQLRHRWRSWLVLALLVGAASGLLIGAAAGARRTASVYDRLVEQSGAFDLGIVARPLDSELADCDEPPSPDAAIACRKEASSAVRKALRSPLVADGTIISSALVPVFTADGRSLQPKEAGDDPCFTGSGEVDIDNFEVGGAVNRPIYISGRAPRARAEVAISKRIAERLDIGLGDELRIVPVHACDGPPQEEWPAPIEVRVVGTQLSPLQVEPESGYFLQSVAVTSPLFAELETEGLGSPFGVLRLEPGVSRRQLVAAAKDQGTAVEIAMVGDEFAADVENSLGPDAQTLWLLVALGAAATAIVLGQAIGRQVQSESADLGALRAMGFTNRDLAAVGAVQGAVIGATSAAVVVAIALAVSPLTPIGRARTIEPDPGFRFDPVVVLGGAALIAVICFVAVIAASWFVARRSSSPRQVRSKPSVVGTLGTRVRLRPPPAYGVRIALEPGRGANTAPVRSGFVGMIAALAVLIGSLTFIAGLDHLVSTPRLVGLNWDGTYFLEDFERPNPDQRLRPQVESALERAGSIDGVTSVGSATFFPLDVRMDAVADVFFMSFGTGPNAIEPTVTGGRPPQGPDEVLVTQHVLDEGGFAIGDTITLHGATRPEDGSRPEKTRSRVEIVGTGVLPIGDGRVDLGAAVTLDGLRRLDPDARAQVALIDFGSDADPRRIDNAMRKLGFRGGLSSREVDLLELVDLDVRPAESTPRLLAALMAILAAGIVLHVVVTVGRARRREIAVLRALGFTPRQVRVSAAWQATTFAVISAAAATVIGIVGGRAVWEAYATRLEIVPEPALAWAGMGIVVVATIVLCNLVALLVGWHAARTHPAGDLRTE